MAMKWVIDPNSRVDLVFYSGLALSGDEAAVRIFPSGQQGDVEFPFQSMRVIGSPGVRVYLCTSTEDEAWTASPWRCIRPLAGIGVKHGVRARHLRIHDLDGYNEPHALSLPPDRSASFPLVEKPEAGEGWTFGRGAGQLKKRIRMIRVVKDA